MQESENLEGKQDAGEPRTSGKMIGDEAFNWVEVLRGDVGSSHKHIWLDVLKCVSPTSFQRKVNIF